MKHTNEQTNDKLAQVVENYQRHIKAKTQNPIVGEIIKDLIDIDLWEMWALTQT